MRDGKQKSNLYNFCGEEMSCSCFSYHGDPCIETVHYHKKISKTEEGKSQVLGAALLHPSKILGEAIKKTETLRYTQLEEVHCSFT
jgi:hypothetical protein